MKSNDSRVEKQLDRELPVPDCWRPTLKIVADNLVSGAKPVGPSIRTVDEDVFSISRQNILHYPDAIGPLTEFAWESSVYIWTGKHWAVLVDLTTLTGKRSDLVLHAEVYEVAAEYQFEIGLVYVP